MAKTTKAGNSAQVSRLREALAREKAKSAALAKSRAEALEQQAAAAEILKVISRSPENAQPVFDAIVKRSMRLMSGHSAMVSMIVEGVLHLAALTSTSKAGDTFLRKLYPRPITRTSPHGIAIHTRQASFITDTEKVPKALARSREIGRARGYRSMVAVPMVREGVAIGCISITRKEPGPFGKHQIDLLKTFADQAVIAIENVRQFNETKEALERQTATAEILRVIASSPTDTRPVFDTISQSAARLCESEYSYVFRFDGNLIHLVAHAGSTGESYEAMQRAWPRAPNMGTAAGRAILTRSIAHVPDVHADSDYDLGPVATAAAYRGTVAVPMLRDGVPIGTINLSRSRAGAYSDRQIGLLQTFADQAVIAIENVRLFNETQEALERQTASSEILRVVARSVADAEPVFHAILASLLRLFEGFDATVWTVREGHLVSVVRGGATLARVATKIPVDGEHPYAAALRDGKVLRLDDVTNARDISEAARADLLGRNRKAVALVPLLRDGSALGALSVSRATPHAFSAVQVELLRNFADQATIAIENARLFNETKDALERQTATADVLRAISTSPTDTQPVFEAILERAAKLCGAETGLLFRYEDGAFYALATRISNPEFAATFREPRRPTPGSKTGLGQLIRLKRTVHMPDLQMDAATVESDPLRMATLRGGMRSWLGVPLLKDGELIGAIVIYGYEPVPFSQSQIALLETFAEQSVIAIENVRLFNETKEALERQTATAEILNVMSASQTDVQPVLEAVAENAGRLCDAQDVSILESDGEVFHVAAFRGAAQLKLFDGTRVTRASVAGRAILDGRLVQVDDITAQPEGEFAVSRAAASSADSKTMLATPLLREGKSIGAIFLRRTEVRPFSARQIELLRTFAGQAAIAIENVRLFNETREALQRQTATAEILKVIAGSPTDVQPVFEVIVQRAVQLCGARFGRVYRYDGSIIEMVAGHGLSAKGLLQVRQVFPRAASDDTIVGQVILTKQPFFIKDIEQDDSVPELSRQMIAALDTRSQVTVPMLRGEEPIGAITLGWDAPRAFDSQKVELLQTFADQAVIAIENVRLFNETKEALERQTATAEILKVIASSPSDVQPVFDAIAASAMRLMGGSSASVVRVVDGALHLAALTSTNEAGDEGLRKLFPAPISALHTYNIVITSRAPFVRSDTETDPSISPQGRELARARGYRSQVAVPMLREGNAIGAIVVARPEPGGFSEHQIGLLETFADQAVIAIENVRLFSETEEALERQTATAEILKVIAGSPADVQPVFDAIVTSAARLFGRRATLRIVEPGGSRRRARSEAAAADSPDLIPIDDASLAGRVILHATAMQVVDTLGPDAPPFAQANAHKWDFRANAAAPLIRDGKAIGSISVASPMPGAMSNKQMELLQTFADQAVIAIENVRLFNETREALERQTATAEVLKVISGSMTDTQPVFDIIAERAARLTRATFGWVFRFDGELIHAASLFGLNSQAIEVARKMFPMPPSGSSYTARAIRDGQVLNVADALAETDPEYATKPIAAAAGYRSVLAVPMFREQQVIGAIAVNRAEAGRFADKEVELLKTFADQAVIAIENVRLFNETKEALERQTATAEILQVIGSSPTDTQPVFDAIVNSGLRLFPGAMITVARPDGGSVRAAAIAHEDATMVAGWKERFTTPLSRDRLHAAAILDARLIDFPNAEAEKDGPFGPGVRNFLLSGNRAVTIMPMLRGESAIGAISVTRAVPGPLSDKQIAILRTFADQAVIAIENVRLFTELEARNKDLGESLDQQKASAEVLDAISSSIADTQPVFDRILKSCERLFGVRVGGITILGEDGKLHLRAFSGPAREEFDRMLFPMSPDGNAGNAVAFMERRILHIPDSEAEGVPVNARRGHRSTQTRASLFAPMLWQDSAIGTIFVSRERPGPYSDKEITLLKTFADQAVIAIENARLFNETKESLERQTATAEILKVIASSPSDVQPVFDAIAASARRLLGGHAANVARRAGDVLELAAFTSTGEAGDSEISRLWPSKITGKGHMGKAFLSKAPAWVEDVETDPGYSQEFRAGARARGMRSAVSVPMLREGEAIGVISVNRSIPGRFSDHQTNLLRTFADQAVIAIENVRLFNETKEALERQTATAEILKVISSSPTDVQPVFDVIVRSASRLCGGEHAIVTRSDGDQLHLVAQYNPRPGAAEVAARLYPLPLRREMGVSVQALMDASVVRFADVDSGDLEPSVREAYRRMNLKAALAVPMLHDSRPIGVISVSRSTPGSFSERQVDLLKTFAEQAVIAIENVRLFKELEERTSALGKSVEKLTALGEVGQAISSTLDLEIVLKTIATHAVKLTGLDGASIYEYDEASEEFRLQVADSFPQEFLQSIRSAPIRKGDGTVGGVAITLEPAQVADILDDSYHSSRKELLVGAGYRAVLTVPLLREDHIIGALNVTRKTPGPFAEEIVELLKTFATQSAMAIQNARLFREIAEKGKQLEDASRHKSQFLASMSHELRTPLNAILGFNEMILGDIYGEVPGDMKEPLTDIQTSGKHLLRLINNVLDLAKIEAGRMELAVDDYSVHDTVESVRSTLRPLAEAKGLDLAVNVPPDIPLARGDGGRITQCLMNLAGNSLKFTKQGSVGISVALTSGTLTYKVQDTGIGIPADKIGGLFTEFKQTDATIASEYGGTGLGLSITKKFIEMHGGRIWAESEPGSGSTFVFEIPLRAEDTGEA